MKKIYIILLIGIVLSSCESYFNEGLEQNIPSEDAFNNVSDISNALNGAYYSFGTYRFAGRNIAAIGDLASDNATTGYSTTGHFKDISTFTYSVTTSYFEEVWTYGYQVVDRATRVINGTKALIEKGNLSNADLATLNSALAQAYGLRAYSAFMMVNIFGLPYGTDDNPNGGLVIIDKEPIDANANVSRASVADTYKWIVADIASANSYPNVISGTPQFYFNAAAVKALEARVNLYMGNFAAAKEAAQKAIDLRAAARVDDLEYVNMWKSLAVSNEDILTICKTKDDNLSANSMNTLYSTYEATLSDELPSIFNKRDVRLNLIDQTTRVPNHPKKFDGISDAKAVNNIPIFRVSEMYLIIAEACAETGDSGAQDALFFTAQRDSSITSASQLPTAKADLLNFIHQERRREFFEEGHRLYEARRAGLSINLNNDKISSFDVNKLVFPIPSAEINAGYGTQQNPTWSSSMPQ